MGRHEGRKHNNKVVGGNWNGVCVCVCVCVWGNDGRVMMMQLGPEK